MEHNPLLNTVLPLADQATPSKRPYIVPSITNLSANSSHGKPLTVLTGERHVVSSTGAPS